MKHMRGCQCAECQAHGTRKYQKGCRCEVCRAANAATVRAHRARKAAGEAKSRTDRLPPGERIGDSHGTLQDYMRGCRCEDCREANRENARKHRQRVKDGTVRKPRPPAAEPKEPHVRSYLGVQALSEGWHTIGAMTDEDGVRWMVAIKDQNPDTHWRTLKVWAVGRAKRKANYWGSYQASDVLVFGRELDLQTMRKHRPALRAYLVKALSAQSSAETEDCRVALVEA